MVLTEPVAHIAVVIPHLRHGALFQTRALVRFLKDVASGTGRAQRSTPCMALAALGEAPADACDVALLQHRQGIETSGEARGCLLRIVPCTVLASLTVTLTPFGVHSGVVVLLAGVLANIPEHALDKAGADL